MNRRLKADHGKRAGYSAGCRCELCTSANAAYARNWRKGYTPKSELEDALDAVLGAAGPALRKRAIQELRQLSLSRHELDAYWRELGAMEEEYEARLRSVRERLFRKLLREAGTV